MNELAGAGQSCSAGESFQFRRGHWDTVSNAMVPQPWHIPLMIFILSLPSLFVLDCRHLLTCYRSEPRTKEAKPTARNYWAVSIRATTSRLQRLWARTFGGRDRALVSFISSACVGARTLSLTSHPPPTQLASSSTTTTTTRRFRLLYNPSSQDTLLICTRRYAPPPPPLPFPPHRRPLNLVYMWRSRSLATSWLSTCSGNHHPLHHFPAAAAALSLPPSFPEPLFLARIH